jgi:hypothetical protein
MKTPTSSPSLLNKIGTAIRSRPKTIIVVTGIALRATLLCVNSPSAKEKEENRKNHKKTELAKEQEKIAKAEKINLLDNFLEIGEGIYFYECD